MVESVLGKPRVLEGWREIDMTEVEKGAVVDPKRVDMWQSWSSA